MAPRQSLNARRVARGVTLIELLIVFAIAAIFAAFAAPSMVAFIAQNRVAGAANEFVAALSLARGEASTRGATVTLRRTSAIARDWTAGWELFVDTNGDGVRDLAAGSSEELLRSGGSLVAPLTMHSSVAAAESVRFRPNGRVLSSGAGTALFLLCYDGLIAVNGRPWSRAILVGDSGRIRVAETNASGQPVNDQGNTVVSCTNPE